jgi:hypothetical protein
LFGRIGLRRLVRGLDRRFVIEPVAVAFSRLLRRCHHGTPIKFLIDGDSLAQIIRTENMGLIERLRMKRRYSDRKVLNRIDDFCLFFGSHAPKERQPQEAITHTFRDGALTFVPAETLPHFRKMQRLIMKDGKNLTLSKMIDQSRPSVERR